MLMLMCQPRLAHAFVELGRGSKELAAAAGELACSAEELAGDVAGLARRSGGDGGGRGAAEELERGAQHRHQDVRGAAARVEPPRARLEVERVAARLEVEARPR